jgi:hypothetical protein
MTRGIDEGKKSEEEGKKKQRKRLVGKKSYSYRHFSISACLLE